MSNIPFNSDAHDNAIDLNTTHRLKVYRRFIDGKIGWDSLDIGQSNYIGRSLGAKENTLPCDFNNEILTEFKGYNTIYCFEVINHVMNPLNFMRQIHSLLYSGGTCYLSCPKLWLIPWHHCKHNFVNYAPERLKKLFEYAGFEVVRHETHNPWPLRFAFTGIRPFFRFLFNRIEVWELRKSS